jgi:sec-independent protein translocase protein TatC
MAKQASQEKHQKHDRQVDAEKQPILSHLMALRSVLIVSLGAVAVGFLIAYYAFLTPLMNFITKPITDRGIVIIYTAVSEALTTQLKVSLMAGVVLASPVIFYKLWSFFKPALYEHEIAIFRMLFFVALFLFLLGVVFCYFFVYGLAVDFFLVAGEDLATPMLSIDKYVGFQFSFLLPFGVAFELPVAIYIAASMGWTNYAKLAKTRRYVLLGLAVIAAILTPPDVVSQIMLLIPMYLLFELGIQVSRFVKPRRRNEEEKESSGQALPREGASS